MENIDKQSLRDVSDEDLLMSQVICGEADLLYLDVFLAEILSKEAQLRVNLWGAAVLTDSRLFCDLRCTK